MRRLQTRLLVAFALAVALSAVAMAEDRFEQITVDNTAGGVAMTTTKITPVGQPQAQYASCRLETAEIRYTIDGTVPTTTVGTLLEIGDTLPIAGHDRLFKFRAIRTGAVSGVLDCTYTP
jgi:hypothetical protein